MDLLNAQFAGELAKIRQI